MLFSSFNLETELIKEKRKQITPVDQALSYLQEAEGRDQEVLLRLKNDTENSSSYTTAVIDHENVYTLEQIKAICIRFRLRFLDTKYFKSDYPYEAILRINDFERKTGNRIEQFKIIAPDQLFNLENINKDPLLFADLGNDRFYLLHKWGNDLAWHKRLIAWPLQSFTNYFISLWVVCFLGSFLLPSSLLHVFNVESEIYLRIWFMIHLFIGLMGTTIWLGLSYDKTFSNLNWNSKYYNY